MLAVPAALGSGSASGGRAASFQPPTLSWSLGGADHYEIEVAADAGFRSPVLGSYGHFMTRNTRATLVKAIPDGHYWWRVRSVGKNGHVSGWTTRSFVKVWRTRPPLTAPGNDATIAYPTQPLVLSWRAIPGAATYSVALARDARFSSLVDGRETETSATSWDPPATLSLGTYYWRVTPLDAEGNKGTPSATRVFRWVWPTKMVLQVRDLVDASELFDPQLSWTSVAGAARYDVDVNFSEDFAPGSRVCCSKPTITTSYTPTEVLPNNRYFWRVRPIDPHGNEVRWTIGQPFVKTFDNVPPVEGSSIKNVRVLGGYTTSAPIVAWDPVPGAAAYEVNLGLKSSGVCSWHPKVFMTAVTAWTPLANSRVSPPYPDKLSVSYDGSSFVLTPGVWCVRVRALNGAAKSSRIYGDFTYLDNAFNFTGFPGGGSARTPSAGEYHQVGTVGTTPLFTWQGIPGAASYWIIVSRDASFTTIVDYALTRIPAYAPRENSGVRTYADETTSYYWAIIPAGDANGGHPAAGDPHQVAPQSFEKRSTPPTLLSPTPAKVIGSEQPVFHWSAVTGARKYRLQVSTDPQFASALLDNLQTDSTAYASETTYPAGKKLYWRVQASDEDKIDLTWSNAGTFEHRLPVPVPLSANARGGDGIPVWRWKPVAGAIGYDLHATLPSGRSKDFSGIPSPAVVAEKMTGLGVFRWQVRALFPKSSGSTIGPYSRQLRYTRTISPPAGTRVTSSGGGLVFGWRPRLGADSYRIEVASSPDFSRRVESSTTQNSSFAPQMTHGYDKGGTFYWHVATVDADGNVGSFSRAQRFNLRSRKS